MSLFLFWVLAGLRPHLQSVIYSTFASSVYIGNFTLDYSAYCTCIIIFLCFFTSLTSIISQSSRATHGWCFSVSCFIALVNAHLVSACMSGFCLYFQCLPVLFNVRSLSVHSMSTCLLWSYLMYTFGVCLCFRVLCTQLDARSSWMLISTGRRRRWSRLLSVWAVTRPGQRVITMILSINIDIASVSLSSSLKCSSRLRPTFGAWRCRLIGRSVRCGRCRACVSWRRWPCTSTSGCRALTRTSWSRWSPQRRRCGLCALRSGRRVVTACSLTRSVLRRWSTSTCRSVAACVSATSHCRDCAQSSSVDSQWVDLCPVTRRHAHSPACCTFSALVHRHWALWMATSFLAVGTPAAGVRTRLWGMKTRLSNHFWPPFVHVQSTNPLNHTLLGRRLPLFGHSGCIEYRPGAPFTTVHNWSFRISWTKLDLQKC